MDGRQTQLKANPLPWLLEPDPANLGIRYFARRDLLGRPADDPEVEAAQAEVMKTGPVPVILDAQATEGYWVKPGPGYSPKYQSTLWSLLFLAQLGCDGRDERMRRAVELVLSKRDGQGRWPLEYSYSGKLWVDVEKKGKPSKWVTLRALRVLNRLGKVPHEWLTTGAA